MIHTRNYALAGLLTFCGLLITAGPALAQHHHHHGFGGHYGYDGGHGHYTAVGHYLHDHVGYGHHHHGYYYPLGYSSYYPSIYSGYYNANPRYGYYDIPYATVAPRQALVAATPAIPSNVAVVEVTLPEADARVWVEGVEMTNRGTTRLLESPELAPDRDYTYTIRAAWNQGDRVMGDERKVKVTTGRIVALDFTRPAERERERMPPPK